MQEGYLRNSKQHSPLVSCCAVAKTQHTKNIAKKVARYTIACYSAVVAVMYNTFYKAYTMQNTTAQQNNVTVINTNYSKQAYAVKHCVAAQNAANAHLYTTAQQQTAQALQAQAASILGARSYVNLRKNFIAVKFVRAAHLLRNATKLKQLQAACRLHNAKLVCTTTNAVVLRLN